jgi:class 3 adenylate cyclase
MMGGKSVPATVLFSDIRGFTTLSEKLGPQGTVNMLNDYFELMVDCITKEGGMLDKFIGDAIMAAFGIPLGHEDDEDRARRASISKPLDVVARRRPDRMVALAPVSLDTFNRFQIPCPLRLDQVQEICHE